MTKQRKISLKGWLFISLLIFFYGVLYLLKLIEYFSWLNLILIPIIGAFTGIGFFKLKRWRGLHSFREQCRQDWGVVLSLGIVFFASLWGLNERYHFIAPVEVYAEHNLIICPTTSQKQYSITKIYTEKSFLYKKEKTFFLEGLQITEENCENLKTSWKGPLYIGFNTRESETLEASIYLDDVLVVPEKPDENKLTQRLGGTQGNIYGKRALGLYWGSFILMGSSLFGVATLISFLLYFILSCAFLKNDESFARVLPNKIDLLAKKIGTEFRQWLPELFVLLVLILAAYGIYFTHNLLIGDDWILLRGPFSDTQGGIGKGRWLRELMRYIYDQGFPMPSVTLASALIGCVISARIQASIIGLKNKFSIFSYIAVFVLYPIWTEPMIFNLERGTIFISMIAIALSTYLIIPIYELYLEKNFLQSLVLFFTSAFLFSIVAAGGQNFIFIGVETFLFALLLKIIKMQKKGTVDFKSIVSRFFVLISVAFTGLILYFLGFMFSLSFYQITESTGNYSLTDTLVSSSPALVETLKQFWSIFVQYLFMEQYFFPIFTKYIFLVFLISIPFLFFFWLFSDRVQPRRKKVLSSAYFLFFWVLLLLTPWGIALTRNAGHWNTYRYNAMLQLATFAAGVIAISLEINQRYWWRKLFQGLAITLIIVYAFQINKASMIMYYNNRRDLAIAQRVLGRIESLPQYNEMEEVNLLILGGIDLQQGRVFDLIEGDQQLVTQMGNLASGCGVWDCQPYRIRDLLWLLSSQDKEFVTVFTQDDSNSILNAFYYSFLKNPMHPWPAEDSIRVLNDNTVVLFLSSNDQSSVWSKIDKIEQMYNKQSQRELDAAEQMLNQIENLPQYDEMEDVKLLILGDTDGQHFSLLSLLSTQDKELVRITLSRDTVTTRDLLVESFLKNPMHIWPAEDSIRVLEDNTIVLFLSDSENESLWSRIYKTDS